jgi:hypothetical protein
MILTPPLLLINSLDLLNLVLSKIRELRMQKVISPSGFHHLQRALVKYIRHLKTTSLERAQSQGIPSPISLPTKLSTDGKDFQQSLSSAGSTMVSDCNSSITRMQSASEKAEDVRKSMELKILQDQRAPTQPVIYAPSSSAQLDSLRLAHNFLEEYLMATKFVSYPPRASKNWILKCLACITDIILVPWRLLCSLFRFVYGIATHHNRVGVILTLLNYMHFLPSHRAGNMNIAVHHAWNQPNYLKIDQNFLLLATKIRLVNKPPPPLHRKEIIRDAFIYLMLCLVLIISVYVSINLSINWN